jgi:hypothetical protein
MPEPELHVRDLTPLVPVCESGRHSAHPGETCEEIDELQAVFRRYLERSLRQAYATAAAEADRMFDQRFLTGYGTGEMRGFLAAEQINAWYPISVEEMADHGITPTAPEPTPVERALAILDPELKKLPGYIPMPKD